MLRANKISIAVFAVVCAVFAFGLVQLFALRFERGDIYPPYSSLRADPLGIKAFYDSLDNLGVPVNRHYKPILKTDMLHTTFFLCGMDKDDLDDWLKNEAEDLEAIAANGRVVITLFPENDSKRAIPTWRELRRITREEQRVKKTKKKESDDETDGLSVVSLKERWHFELSSAPLDRDDETDTARATNDANESLNEPVTWHSRTTFKNLGTEWNVIYERDDEPVIIERRFSNGSIVLCADSFFLSNEALAAEPHPELLAWLVGGAAHATFDETHLGVGESPGVMSLAREYHLYGFFATLLLLAGLFIWKNSVSFVPAHRDEVMRAAHEVVHGQDAAAGFTNLLRRTIPPHQLLAACFDEWKKTFARGRKDLKDKTERMQGVIYAEQSQPTRQRHPVQAYQELTRIVNERKSS